MLPDFRIHQRDYLLEISRIISQELNLDIVLERIIKISVEMLAGQAGLIALRKVESGWYIANSNGLPVPILKYIQILFSQIQYQSDAINDELPQIYQHIQTITDTSSSGLLTSVGLPLIVHDRLIGVIVIFRSYTGGFSTNDRALLQSFADQAAIAVNNAQLYTQVSQEKQRIDALLDTVADGIIILTKNQTIERCNPAFERMVGLSKQQIIEQPHENIIQWKVRRHGISLEEAIADGSNLINASGLYVEGDIQRGKQSPLPVAITYAPLISEDGILLNIIATVRDITRFREAEEMKSTFISVVSHELKTPVALIKGYVATLRREDVVWEQEVIQDSLKVIEEEADHLAELIENLLDASRLQAKGLKLSLAQVRLDLLAQRIVRRFKDSFYGKALHSFSLDFLEDFPIIMGDEARLTQVYNNLISNAIKYSSDGGSIRLSGQIQQNQVIICIQDQGLGIAPVDIPHIFDRFYRANEVSQNTKGAGLGLYLTRAIIEAHGGSIWVDSHYKDGAKICFSIPKP